MSSAYIGIFIGMVLMIPVCSFFSDRARMKKEQEMKLKQWKQLNKDMLRAEGKTIDQWLDEHDTRPKDWYRN